MGQEPVRAETSASSHINDPFRRVHLKAYVLYALAGFLGPLIAFIGILLSTTTDSGIFAVVHTIGLALWPFWWLGWFAVGPGSSFGGVIAVISAFGSNILIFLVLGFVMKALSTRPFAVRALIVLLLFGAVWAVSAALI